MKGCISPRGKGVWQLKYDLPRDGSGPRRTRYKTVTGTKADAQRELRGLLEAVDKGTHVDRSKLTLGAYLDAWMKGAAIAGLSPKTLERYGQLILKISSRGSALR